MLHCVTSNTTQRKRCVPCSRKTRNARSAAIRTLTYGSTTASVAAPRLSPALHFDQIVTGCRPGRSLSHNRSGSATAKKTRSTIFTCTRADVQASNISECYAHGLLVCFAAKQENTEAAINKHCGRKRLKLTWSLLGN